MYTDTAKASTREREQKRTLSIERWFDLYKLDDPIFDGVSVRMAMVSPAIAEQLLADHERTGFRNRDIVQTRITRYSLAMKERRWVFTGESVIVGKRGEIYNGIHRLLSIAQTGQTVPLLLVFGVGEQAFDAMDSGRIRQLKDVAKSHEFENVNVLSSAARWLYRYENGGIFSYLPMQTFDNTLGIGMIAKHPGLANSVSAVSHLNRISAPSPLAFLHYLFHRIEPALAGWFFERIADGIGVSKSDAVYHLRERLIDNKGSRAKLAPEYIVVLIVKAWNAHREKRPMSQLKLPKTGEGKMPEIL